MSTAPSGRPRLLGARLPRVGLTAGVRGSGLPRHEEAAGGRGAALGGTAWVRGAVAGDGAGVAAAASVVCQVRGAGDSARPHQAAPG